jgi:mRNA-degrading endonuclease RelE of RelBE toxin-antitoxin system
MPTKVNVPAPFVRDLQRLAKKYPAVVKTVEALAEQLKNDERPGDKIPGVGHDVYKVRLANPSAKRGKSGGFRVIYYVQLVDSILLLTIYSKTEQTDISAEQIRRIVEELMLPDDESDNR